MTLSRRTFIEYCGAAALGFAGLNRLLTTTAFANPDAARIANPYGPPIDDPQSVIALPKGFSYKIIAREGDTMSDGFIVPGLPDAMAAFPGPSGETIVICNHELRPNDPGPFGKDWSGVARIDPAKVYDFGSGKTPSTGGTSTFIFDTDKQEIQKHFLSLVGTHRNCAGGPTPWGTWISCEEMVISKGYYEEHDYTADKDHGYNFEVPATVDMQIADPIALTAMGRFNHEAVCVDPRTGIVYQTEDRHDGLITRFIPDKRGDLSSGRLQALCVRDKKSCDTRNWDAGAHDIIPVREACAVDWYDLEDIQAPEDDLRIRGFNDGCARFARGEGMWFGDNEAFFACTNGGPKKYGQIWRYVPSEFEGTAKEKDSPGHVEIFLEPMDTDIMAGADNLTVTPWGDLMVCEDHSGETIRLVGVTPEGKCYTFARNMMGSEFAGACFSPDGSTMFVNIQGAGAILAITGPWA